VLFFALSRIFFKSSMVSFAISCLQIFHREDALKSP
jgi:hypothetical protein